MLKIRMTEIRGGEIESTGLSSLRINMIATEIRDVARESARTGKRINLPLNPRF